MGSGGDTFALPSVGGHPGLDINILLILLKKPCKKLQNYSRIKNFQINDIANIIPMLIIIKYKSSSKNH